MNIVVPQLGESVVEARVARWLKKEGDRVETGEPVVELETEKIDLEVGADHGGVITSIKRKEGEDVKVGDLLVPVVRVLTTPIRAGLEPALVLQREPHLEDELRVGVLLLLGGRALVHDE